MKILGLILIVAGLVCIAIPSITFFTHERVADAGYFHIDVSKPHTIVLNPAAGILAVVVGLLLLVFSLRRA